MNVDKMRLAGNVLDAAVKGLTEEEVGRMLLMHAPVACRWVVDYYNENEKKEKEEWDKVDKITSLQEKFVESSKAIAIVVSALQLLKDEWLKKVPWRSDYIQKIEEVRDKVVAMLIEKGGE